MVTDQFLSFSLREFRFTSGRSMFVVILLTKLIMSQFIAKVQF